MTATKLIGRDAKAYYNTGTHAAPAWSEMKRIKDLSIPFAKGEVDILDRESGWKKTVGGQKEFAVSFVYNEKVSAADAAFDKLWDSYLIGTAVEMAFMNGSIAVAGKKGFRGYFEVFEMERSEELEGICSWDISIKLTEHEEAGAVVEPDRYTVP
jgi:predicted secreted protein